MERQIIKIKQKHSEMYTVTIGCGTRRHETHDRLGRQDGSQIEEHGNMQGGQNTDMTKGARESERGTQRAREDKRERETYTRGWGKGGHDRQGKHGMRGTWEEKRETRHTFCYKVGICRFS